MKEPCCPRCKVELQWMMNKGQAKPTRLDWGYQCPECALWVCIPPSQKIVALMDTE